MAVFYKHIKGTNTAGNLWTWIKWSENTVSNKAECTPEIILNDKNDLVNGTTSLGHIITSEATEQNINAPIIIPNINFTDSFNIKYKDSQGSIHDRVTINNNNIRLFGAIDFINTDQVSYAKFEPALAKLTIDMIQANKTISATGNIHSSTSITAPTANFSESGGTGECKAIYFNATSDKRAKDHINPVLTHALDIINNVKVYTFNYLDRPKEKMIGVIAQDFLDKKLDGVSFVQNEEATGKDGDYMSIRESKLVYLLLKGVQEQQEEIETLKRHIKRLESER